MNEQAMIERGTAARELLDNQTFQAVAKDLMDIYINTFIQTAPDDSKARESAYFQSRALQDLIAVLNQWVVIKDNILDSRSEGQTNSEEE